MIDLNRLLDGYNRHARLYPALLALLPPLALTLALFPSLTAAEHGAALVGIAAATGVFFLAADFARSFGKRVERALLDEWGGWPTTIWLRHRSVFLSDETKARYRARLSARLPDLRFPSADQEKENPAAADDAYSSAIEWLKEQCRGRDYPLVAKENATYGFRRNVLGLRPVGAVAASATLLAAVILLAINHTGPVSAASFRTLAVEHSLLLLASLFALLAVLVWATVVTRSWVRQAGDAYARALLACCESL